MRLVIKILFLLLIFLMTPTYAWVENGLICYTHGKHHLKSCREPRDAADLQRAIDDDKATSARINLSNRYDSCQFSMFKGWDSEISRLRKKNESESRMLGFANSEKYWAAEDIRKSEVLPSETVRSAYSTMSIFNQMSSESEKKIELNNWCLSCAMKKPKDYMDCR